MKGSRRLLGGLCALLLLASLVPIVTQAAQNGFTKQAGHFNAAYIEWEPVAGATGYQVFIKKASAADSAYTRIDEQLVRQYPDHWRADALGLAAGEYVMKVLPVKSGTAMTSFVTDTLTVLNHERTGYAFYNGNIPGAYKMDGTLKDKAQVIYVTNDNKNSVKLGSYTGLQNIVSNVNKIGTPVDIRILGKITGVSGNLLTVSASNANLTIEGVGNDTTAYGWGFKVSGSHIEIANIATMLVDNSSVNGYKADGDGITVSGASYLWVHNCEFFYNAYIEDKENDKLKGDGALDTDTSHYCSYSYNHFWDNGKCSLQDGTRDAKKSDYITYHHNWYDHSDSRHPRVRHAHVHVYNNFYDDNDEYGMAACHNSTVFSENNYFDGCPRPMLIARQGSGTSGFGEDNGGILKAYGNVMKNYNAQKCVPYSQNSTEFDYYDAKSRNEQVPSSVKTKVGSNTYDNFDTKSDFYTYTPDDANDVPAKVTAYAGRVGSIHFPFDMNDLTYHKVTTRDAKYNREMYHHPDPALLAAIEGYTVDLVSVGDNGGATLTDPNPSPSSDPTPTPTPPTPTPTPPTPTPTPPTPTPTPPTPTPTPPAPTPSGNTLGGTVYTLTGDEVYAAMEQSTPAGFTKNPSTSTNPNSYVAGSAVTDTAGTDNFFTLYYTSGTRIDPVQKTFADDDYQANYRINFSNKAEVEKNAIQFTTDGPATVKVWWVGGGGASKPARSMTILDSSGQTYRTSSESSNSTETPMFSTLELDKGGTWYLGGDVGKNFIYKVTVSVGGDSLGWNVDGDTLSLTGDVGANQTVWAACWDMAKGFLSAVPLTGVDPTASLPEGWQTVKLIWLDSRYAPKCPAGSHQK